MEGTVLSIREVRIMDYAEQALSLMHDNWAETGFNFPLDPDFTRYQQLQDMNVMFALAAFDSEDRLIGYSSAMVSPTLFNPRVVMCATDALFVSREHRHSILSARLICKTEQTAKQRGAHFITWHTRAGTDVSGMFRMRPEYAKGDDIVLKEL